MKKQDFKKLKPYYIWAFILIPFVAVPLIIRNILHENIWVIVVEFRGAVFAITALLLFGSFGKSKNLFLFLSGLLFLNFSVSDGLHVFFPVVSGMYENFFDFSIIILLMIVFIWMIKEFPDSDLFMRKFRVILETAARPVIEAGNGYTNRAYPLEKTAFSKEQVINFAKLLNKNLIATSYIREDRVILVFSNGLFQYIPFLRPNLQKVTYASFWYSGEVSVNISKKDYKKYREELTFDQLCKSFGNMILDFFKEFLGGNKKILLNKFKVDLNQPIDRKIYSKQKEE